MVIGIDEVGRGAWAGPLCVGAVLLGEARVEGLTDSKKLTKKRREALAHQLKLSGARLGVGWVSAKVIDQIGMGEALRLAAKVALDQIDGDDVEQIIIDGTVRLIDDPRVTTLKQADLLVPCVSAASIIAKVARDDYMKVIAKQFSEYGFDKHVGYGTSVHEAALKTHGPSPLHRMSFAPMKDTVQNSDSPKIITTGQMAEEAAVKYLTSHGYQILERNWRTKWCEIDVIAYREGGLYFVEVKYRRNNNQGDGLAAITISKQRQMRYAANFWLHAHPKVGYKSAKLSAMALAGEDYSVITWLDDV